MRRPARRTSCCPPASRWRPAALLLPLPEPRPRPPRLCRLAAGWPLAPNRPPQQPHDRGAQVTVVAVQLLELGSEFLPELDSAAQPGAQGRPQRRALPAYLRAAPQRLLIQQHRPLQLDRLELAEREIGPELSRLEAAAHIESEQRGQRRRQRKQGCV